MPAFTEMHIVFSRARSPLAFLSKIIMWVEKRPYSHVSVHFQEPATRMPLVFQASKGLVNFFYKDTFDRHNVVTHCYVMPVSPAEYMQIWQYSVKKMGSDYGWLELVSIATEKLFHVKGWFRNGNKSNICSELAARVCRKAGLAMPENLDNLTPSGLHNFIKEAERGNVIRLTSYV